MNWDARYGNIEVYKRNCAIAHKSTNNICVVCLKNKSNQIHHAYYGGDRLGESTFPVCESCHKNVCHSSKNWIKSHTNPVWNNRNTPDFIKRLKLGYELLYGGIKYGQ